MAHQAYASEGFALCLYSLPNTSITNDGGLAGCQVLVVCFPEVIHCVKVE